MASRRWWYRYDAGPILPSLCIHRMVVRYNPPEQNRTAEAVIGAIERGLEDEIEARKKLLADIRAGKVTRMWKAK